jgi:hypothetical protein
MQKIILINDHSNSSIRVTEYANKLASTYGRDIIILSKGEISLKKENMVLAKSDSGDDITSETSPAYSVINSKILITSIKATQPWMIIMSQSIYEESLLNHVQCPVLIFPEDIEVKMPERIAYLADLRYAQVPVLHYLAKLNNGQENIILAHRCATGLPELARSYTMDLFNIICRQVQCPRIFLSQMIGGNMSDVVDQVVNGIEADILVCVNRHFYFNEIMNYLSVPTLIFPS